MIIEARGHWLLCYVFIFKLMTFTWPVCWNGMPNSRPPLTTNLVTVMHRSDCWRSPNVPLCIFFSELINCTDCLGSSDQQDFNYHQRHKIETLPRKKKDYQLQTRHSNDIKFAETLETVFVNYNCLYTKKTLYLNKDILTKICQRLTWKHILFWGKHNKYNDTLPQQNECVF